MKLNSFKKFSTYKEKGINTNKDVWVYTRVSTKGQFDNNGSIDNQKESAEAYAKKKDYNITKCFGGTYESASSDFTRKEFKELLTEVKKARKKPFAILIYKMNRFSRTGGGAIGVANELINDVGVHLIEVLTGKDTTTQRGDLELMESLLQAKRDNLDKLDVTLPGLQRLLKNGNHLGVVPMGYDHYGPKVKDPKKVRGEQKIVINQEGILLKQAWNWKSTGVADYEIIKRLEARGLSISKQKISAMWRKPFYAGVITNSLLEGNVVQGHWKPLVSKKDFMKINELLSDSSRTGYTVCQGNDSRPLQGQLYCEFCASKMTGYANKKNIHYYKCQNNDCSCKDLNANTGKRTLNRGLNDRFEDLLIKHELNPKYAEALEIQLLKCLDTATESINETLPILKKKRTELTNKLEVLEERFTLGEIGSDLYQKYSNKFENELRLIVREINESGKSTSNLNEKVKKCVRAIQNISETWGSGDFSKKQRVQKVVFGSVQKVVGSCRIN
jgi:DNA invertase Pin-like site-specific DNA recombinase